MKAFPHRAAAKHIEITLVDITLIPQAAASVWAEQTRMRASVRADNILNGSLFTRRHAPFPTENKSPFAAALGPRARLRMMRVAETHASLSDKQISAALMTPLNRFLN